MTEINFEEYDEIKSQILEDLKLLGEESGIILYSKFENVEGISELSDEELEDIKKELLNMGYELEEDDEIEKKTQVMISTMMRRKKVTKTTLKKMNHFLKMMKI